ncbi:hypothetical protein [Paenibacillus sp. Marseille-Q4541]|nr:hypothetical protein [Paenibacillus sp. Marseille-Q4541]
MLANISVSYATEYELEASSHSSAARIAAMFTNMNTREDFKWVKEIYACD